MRNKALPGFKKLSCGCIGTCSCPKRSPLNQIESVSDSANRGNVGQEIKILGPKKGKTLDTSSSKPGKLYSKDEQQLKAMVQANPIARLFSGIKPKSS